MLVIVQSATQNTEKNVFLIRFSSSQMQLMKIILKSMSDIEKNEKTE